MHLTSLLRSAAVSVALIATPVVASDDTARGSTSGETRGSHAGEETRGSNAGDHSAMAAPAGGQAVAEGVVNAIDMDTGVINVTHEPVEALGWPKMTMDLPTTRRVDLSSIEVGAPVSFTLKQGRDKQFRVIAIEPMPVTN